MRVTTPFCVIGALVICRGVAGGPPVHKVSVDAHDSPTNEADALPDPDCENAPSTLKTNFRLANQVPDSQ